MLQNQYYNSILKKEHIEKILTNYNIKYNTMKNEIDAKFNNMIKLFINDIKAFLENIEEIFNERKKIKESENREMELITLKNKLVEQNKTESQLRNELELVINENKNLKKKIKLKEQIIKNKKLYFETTSNELRVKTESNPYKNRSKQFTTRNKTIKREKIKNNNISLDIKTESKRPTKKTYPNKKNQLSMNVVKNINSDNKNYVNEYIKSRKKMNNSMDKRIVNNKPNLKKNIILKEKSPQIKSNQETKCSSNIQNIKNKSILNDEKLITVEMPFSDQSFVENESVTTDEILDEEIKELEMEEENIILLMEKIKKLNQNI